jgi:hypothetical protein
VNVEINKAWGNDQIAGVDFFIRAAANFSRSDYFRNFAVAQKHVHGRIDFRRGVNEMSAFDEQAIACVIFRHGVLKRSGEYYQRRCAQRCLDKRGWDIAGAEGRRVKDPALHGPAPRAALYARHWI